MPYAYQPDGDGMPVLGITRHSLIGQVAVVPHGEIFALPSSRQG